MIALLLVAVAADAQFGRAVACPKVFVPGVAHGTGVVVGTKDGFAFLLTAAHVVPSDRVELQFASRATYPRFAWIPDDAFVVARWPDPDLALVKFPHGQRAVPVLPLAPAWDRPKAFPFAAQSVGVASDRAATVRGEAIRAKEFVARDNKKPAFFWRAAAPPEPGRSGGPLIDGRGRVIGIAAAASGGAGYYAHHDEIAAALAREGYGWLVPTR